MTVQNIAKENGYWLVVDSVSKSFGETDKVVNVINKLSFDVREGEFVSIFGPNGCGKTTLLNLIAGISVPQSGRIIKSSDDSPIGIVFQNYDKTLFPWKSCLENICFPLESAHSLNKKARYEKGLSVVSKLGLNAHGNEIYPLLAPEFYNNYLPFQWGEHIKTPKQLGWYMINFNMTPGQYNPSSHVNLSRSRESYIKYESALDPATSNYIIRPDNPCQITVLADCINFLAVEGGQATIKFAT